MEPSQVPVKEAITVASIINHIKNNRIEYLLVLGLSHLLGLSDHLFAYGAGICA